MRKHCQLLTDEIRKMYMGGIKIAVWYFQVGVLVSFGEYSEK